jgi:DNA-binding XRE family transcriptional regulator
MNETQIALAPVRPYTSPVNSRMLIAARNLLGWTQARLAAEANVSRATVITLEAEAATYNSGSMNKVVSALKSAGIEFTEAPDRMTVSAVLKKESPE